MYFNFLRPPGQSFIAKVADFIDEQFFLSQPTGAFDTHKLCLAPCIRNRVKHFHVL